MFRSIRVTLLFWYAVILTGSIAVLGAVLHPEMRSSLYREADGQLTHWIEVLRNAVDRNAGAGDAREIGEVVRSALPEGIAFALFDGGGRLRAASSGLRPATPPDRSGVVTRDDHRWLAAKRPGEDGWLVVGRSVREENHGIRRFLIVLLATGSGIAILAVGGGYLLVSRVLAPARDIARTARRISARNLGERIPLTRVPTELLELATALNESFERLHRSFAAQVAFTADASHELRTPLAILRSHLELATSNDPTAEQLGERLGICREAVQRLEAIVASLLTLARADSGELQFREGEIDLAALVEAEVDAMRPLAGLRGVEMEVRATPVTVPGDSDRLREAVANLVDNAIRYNREGGRVTVIVARKGDEAVLRVADTGIGIAEVDRERIFERFFRVDAARSRSQGGSGLGLSIARCIVERHGGSITADGRIGEGTEFTVRLHAGGIPDPDARPGQ